VGFSVALKIGQVHVIIAVTKQSIEDRSENARLIRVEVIGGDEVQGGAGFGIVLVMPARILETARVRDLCGTQPKQKEVFLARGFGHLDGGAVAGADGGQEVGETLNAAAAVCLRFKA
jgi:hypothetical protein